MKYGIIYKFTNKINGKVYIGKTVQPFHRRCRPNAYKSCVALQNAIDHYGWDTFHKEEFISALDESYLVELEEKTIKFYDCLAPKGYNLIEVDKGLNRYPDSVKKKISDKRKVYLTNLETPLIAPNRIAHLLVDSVACKACTGCKVLTPLAEYTKDKNRWDGLSAYCKSCRRSNQTPYKRKTEAEVKQSYVDRKVKMTASVRKAYQDPELKAVIAERMSKAIIGTHVKTGKQVEFASGLDAKEAGFCNARISAAIKRGWVHKKHTWRFK